jgi:hypothetical protein
MDDDGAQNSPYCVVPRFCLFGIPCVWPHSQKHASPWIANFGLSHHHEHMRGNHG